MSGPSHPGPWWVDLLEHAGRRYLLRMKFDAAGRPSLVEVDPLGKPASLLPPTPVMIAAARAFGERHRDHIAGAQALAEGRDEGVYAAT